MTKRLTDEPEVNPQPPVEEKPKSKAKATITGSVDDNYTVKFTDLGEDEVGQISLTTVPGGEDVKSKAHITGEGTDTIIIEVMNYLTRGTYQLRAFVEEGNYLASWGIDVEADMYI